MKILFLEPFYGGSHQDFADGLIQHSRHSIELVSLPARFWKWRMRGASLFFLSKIESFAEYDGLICTSLLSVSDLKALAAQPFPPILLYFHENQFNYPLAPGETIDYQFGFTNITSALTADRIVFNSHTHQQRFLESLPTFIRMMPDCHPPRLLPAISQKASVIHPGCHFAENLPVSIRQHSKAPRLVWNHRWEFDKRPDVFLKALDAVCSAGIDFRLIVLGESYCKQPAAFETIKKKFADHLDWFGYVQDRETYYNWLSKGDIVISTADQENFGIAVVEAIRHGCLPLLPGRLSYPELLPHRFHADCLYNGFEQLVSRLITMIKNIKTYAALRRQLSEAMKKFSWENQSQAFDRALDELVCL